MTSSPKPTTPSADGARGERQRRRNLLAWGAGGMVASLAAFGAATMRSPSPAPMRWRGTGRVPDVPLVTHEGKPVRFYSDLVKDRLVLVNMMYAQCNDRCPPMTFNLRQVQEALGGRVGRDVFMYSVSLLPEHDRPADLRGYMDQHRVGPGWTFLTGTKDAVEQLRFGMGFFDPDPARDADLAQHIGMVRIGNDALDRWCMAPLLQEPALILEAMTAVDPVSRMRSRAATPRVA
ncbi:SCO family protein [Ramlibacter sp. AN1015]|uniref:SCO family protein n=1 Tax=Ramlibacter sp. AN1015 TaxID=3133428 RepID=UPI0030BABF9A